jgi:hypothetical protein
MSAGCVAVIFTYFALGFYAKRLPKIGIYSAVVMQVSKKIVFILMTMSCYFIGFSIAFYIIFVNTEIEYEWSWLLRTPFMMMGNFDFDDFYSDSNNDIQFFVMAVSLIGLPIVANNILLSFSIEDQKDVMGSAFIQNLKTAIQFFNSIDGLSVAPADYDYENISFIEMIKHKICKKYKPFGAFFYFDASKCIKKIDIAKADKSLLAILRNVLTNESKESIIKQADKKETELHKWLEEQGHSKQNEMLEGT